MGFIKNVLGFACFTAICLGIVFFVLYPSVFWLVTSAWIAAAVFFLLWLALNRAAVWRFLTQKSTHYGANLALIVLLVFGILVSVNYLAKDFHWRKDISFSGTNTLSEQTKKILHDLKQDVKLTYFVRIQEREKAEKLFRMYTYESKHFSYEIIDPNRQPTLTKSMGVTKFDTAVLSLKGEGAKKVTVDAGAAEEKLTNGLVRLLKTQSQILYYTVGHGERNFDEANTGEGYGAAKEELEKEAYQLKALNLLTEGKIPADAAMLFVIGPRTAFFPKELEIISDWIKNGGHIFIAVDLEIQDEGLSQGSKQIAGVLAAYGVEMGNEMLIDPTSRAANVEPQVLMALAGSREHVITKDFPSSSVGLVANFLFPITTYLKKKNVPEAYKISSLAKTTASAWAESDWKSLRKGAVGFESGKDFRGEMDLAYAIEEKAGEEKEDKAKKGGLKIAVFANSAFASSAFSKFSGNRDLFMNTVAWLTNNNEYISIRPKDEDSQTLNISQNWLNFVFLFVVFIMPIAILVAGIWVWIGRKNK